MPTITSTILDQISAEKSKVSERLARLDSERTTVDWEALVARCPAPLRHQLLHMVAHLVEPREPDAALRAHIVGKFEDRLEPGKAARQRRMPDRDPQRAVFPGRVEFAAEDLHRALWRGDRHPVAEIAVVGVVRESSSVQSTGNSSSEALPSRRA